MKPTKSADTQTVVGVLGFVSADLQPWQEHLKKLQKFREDNQSPGFALHNKGFTPGVSNGCSLEVFKYSSGLPKSYRHLCNPWLRPTFSG